MRFILLFILSYCGIESLSAQVAKTVVVEHFTNTRCGICSFRNPDLFDNLDNNPEILHLAIHPSAPYSNCILNQHNTAENDARTNFYDIYGSTPRIVIQGEVSTSSSGTWDDPDLFSPYQNQTSPVRIEIQQMKTTETIESYVRVFTEAENDLTDLNLYVVLAEDTIFYEAPNGENLHFNVFRENISEENGTAMTLAEEVNGEKDFFFSTPVNAEWVVERIFTMVILQDANTNEVIQAAAASPDLNEPITLTNTEELSPLEGIAIFPNPTADKFTIQLHNDALSKGQLYHSAGLLLQEINFQGQATMDLKELPIGTYFLRISNEQGSALKKIIRE